MTNEEQQKHEAAIEAWRKEAKRVPDRSRVGNCYIIADEEIDDICDLARRAPASEPRPSSALLEAARNALAALRSGSAWPLSESLLLKAIKAEEARGPSEPVSDAYKLPEPEQRASSALLEASDKLATHYASKELIDRAVVLTGRTLSNNNDSCRYLRGCSLLVKDLAKAAPLPEEIESRDLRRDWVEDAAHENGGYFSQCSSCGNLFLGHKRRVTCRVCADAREVEQLRKERDEALARAEKAEDQLAKATTRACYIRAEMAEATADAKLREFADWIRSHGDTTEEEALTEIDRLLANPPSDVAILDPDDELLRDWLDTHNPDDAMSTTSRQDLNALAVLCRRALEGK